MKWKNKGHEYDDRYEIYREGLNKHKGNFCIFGAGKIGKKGIGLFAELGWELKAVIDNDPEKRGKTIEDIPIISFDDHDADTGYIVVCVSDKYKNEIIEQIRARGFKDTKDFCDLAEFEESMIPIVSLFRDNKLRLGMVELAVTERCTLRCKKCAHGCGYVPHDREDYPIEEVKRSVDELFRLVDYIEEFYLIGGETLLYKQIDQAIEYVGSKYRDKINRFIITTNGTIIPSREVVLLAGKHHLTFYISNYSAQLPKLSDNYTRFATLLDNHGVSYLLGQEERVWYDYGFEYVDHEYKEEVMIQNLDHCPIKCREIRGSKFYFCIQARTVADNMKFDVDQNDHLELSGLDMIEGKKILLEYSNGYSEKGYIDMCNHCNGEDMTKYMIPAAEQMDRGTPYRR